MRKKIKKIKTIKKKKEGYKFPIKNGSVIKYWLFFWNVLELL